MQRPRLTSFWGLREVLGLLHMSDELERMGDHCINVARVAVTYPAFRRFDRRSTYRCSHACVPTKYATCSALSSAGTSSERPGTRLILVAVNLERIADRVTNLAEDLVFLETGDVEDLGR